MATTVPPALAQSSADMAVTKSGPTQASAGSNVTYTITVFNAGPSAAANATMTDNIPAGMTFVSEVQTSGPAFTCTNPLPGDTTGGVSCVLNPMAAGSTAVFSIAFNIPPATPPGTSFTNTATVSTTTFDPNVDNDSASTGTFVAFPTQSDAGVSKTGPAAAGPNTNVVYSISITNAGPNDATDFKFNDTLPGTMTFVSLVQNSGPALIPPCTTPAPGSGGTINCSPALFAAGATATFTLTGHIPAGTASGTNFMNIATVSATGDPNPENDSSNVTTTVSSVDVSVTKTGPATATAGTAITYTLTVANAGPDSAVNVTLSDAMPAGTQFVSFTQTGGTAASCSPPSAGTIYCTFVPIPSGGSAQFSLVINTGSTTSITNTATVTTESFDTNSSNNTATASTVVTQSADVAVTKTGPATITAGSNVTYTVTVANNGPSVAANVSLTDVIPAGMTFVSASQTGGVTFTCTTPPAGGTGTITCTIASLSPGSATFSFVMAAAASAANGSSISNVANVTSATADPNGSNNTSTTTATVTTAADVGVMKTGPAGVTSGSNVTYTISVTNSGPSDASSVALTDAVPAQTTFVSSTQTAGPTFTCTTPPAGGTGTITCNLASLPAAGSATFQLVVRVASGATGTITNTANVTSTNDSTPANNTSTATAVVGAASVPALSPLALLLLTLALAAVALRVRT